MDHAFYNSPAYKHEQSVLTKQSWLKGKYANLIKPLRPRVCVNPTCKKRFFTKASDPKMFCCHSCSATVSNHNRTLTLETRQKISTKQKISHYKLIHPFKDRVPLICQNPNCKKEFHVLPYLAKTRKYCCASCAITTIGHQTTSPKASKGKPGIRPDIDPEICFYSTWEANVARVFNLVGLHWTYSPKIFDLGAHTYRPDFYLPDFDEFIEIKNFMNPYSAERDRLFREKFPNIKLYIFSKSDYLQLKSEYKVLIPNWEC